MSPALRHHRHRYRHRQDGVCRRRSPALLDGYLLEAGAGGARRRDRQRDVATAQRSARRGAHLAGSLSPLSDPPRRIARPNSTASRSTGQARRCHDLRAAGHRGRRRAAGAAHRTTVFIDIFARWQMPVILCARTALGTINHTLLSIEALRAAPFRSSASPSSATRIAKPQRIDRRKSAACARSAACLGLRSTDAPKRFAGRDRRQLRPCFLCRRRMHEPLDQSGIPSPSMRSSRRCPASCSTEGAYLHDADGTRILDAISSWWVITHGHRHPAIMEAIRTATETLDQIIFAGFTHEPAERLAEAPDRTGAGWTRRRSSFPTAARPGSKWR